ncbi:MAG: hypothetical protein ACLPPV_11690 [Candidatus Korobacteraceae bacterium]|jgi:hypothetical protein
MSSFSAARRVSRELRTCALILLVGWAVAGLHAQCPIPPSANSNDPNLIFKRPAPPKRAPGQELLLPEAGFLSNTHYTSQFFGFGFELPLTVQGHEIMLPVMPEKQHALLMLQYEKGDHNGYIQVTATDPRPGYEVSTPEKEQDELERWAKSGGGFGGQPAFPVPAFMLRSGRFFSSTRRVGRNYAAQYWTGINNYMIKVVIRTNDKDFLRKAKDLMADAVFYCPQDDGSLIDEEGKPVKVEGAPYTGPTVPTFKVNNALRDEPGKSIPPGEVVEGVYRNPEAGLQYRLPAGWDVIAADKSDPPTPPQDESMLREYKFFHACSQTLLQIAPRPPVGLTGQPPGPTITLRALDPDCLSMRTAASLTDKRAADEVAASLEQTGEFGEIDSDALMSIHGHLFMIFQGTMATTQRGEDLGQRMSQAIFATRYNKLLLMWSVMAPDAAALAQVPTSDILFDGSPPIELRASLLVRK